MKNDTFLLIICLFFCGFIFNGTYAQQDSIPFKNLEFFIDNYIKKESDTTKKAPTSLTLSIVKNGKLLLSKGYGPENIEKRISVTPQKSIFRIGSTSKTFTYTAIMQLVEQRKLDLDADVNTYLKDFKIPDTYKKPITIRSIVTHSAGFEDGFLGHLFVDKKENILPLKKAVEKFMPARVSTVGSHSSYSNYGISLLGVIIENVSGLTYEDYIAKNIHKPLKMNNSSFHQPLPEKLKKNLTYPYKNENNKLVPQDFMLITHDSPAGGMSSTANDMAKFMLMYLSNGTYSDARILNPETVKFMRTWQFGSHKDYPGMAFGFYQKDFNGHKLYGHAGGTLNFTTDMMLDANNNLGIFISATGTNAQKIAGSFIKDFYNHYYPAKPSKEILASDAPKDFNERVKQYEGQYFNWRGNFSQIEKLMHILGGTKVKASDRNTLLIDNGFSEDEYVEIDKHLFQKVKGNDLIAFTEDKNGNIINMHNVANPVMTSSKGPFYFFKDFNFPLLGISFFLFFVSIVLSIYYKIKKIKNTKTHSIRKVAFWMSITNILFVALLALVGISNGMNLAHTVPWYLNIVMLLPIIASVLAIYFLFKVIKMWKIGQLSILNKTYYSLVSFAGLFMTWFYYFWNILGFKYF